jgi:hypothetical protein
MRVRLSRITQALHPGVCNGYERVTHGAREAT